MNKIVIGVFGKINSGKSTLVNSLARENISIVSNVKGSTSDSIFKMTEIKGIGKVQLVDTAGFDDNSELASERLFKVNQVFDICDIAILVCGKIVDDIEQAWINKCESSGKKFIICHNIFDCDSVAYNENEFVVNVADLSHIDFLVGKIKNIVGVISSNLLDGLIKNGQTILLCVPQDEEAPTDRLILPQSVVIKEIIQKGSTAIATDSDNFADVFVKYKDDLSLVITDSSVFEMVYSIVGHCIPITSFSVLFAKRNGDIETFVNGANSLEKLQNGDKVLIMEACSHTLSHKDIGSVLIPNLIKKYTGKKIIFEILRGKDVPINWNDYKLVVHCGGCVQNREFMMSRINSSKKYKVPITNYGILIAKINGILDKIVY